jgi:hypothetical protein
MSFWNIEPTDKFLRKYKLFENKYPSQLIAMWNNLDTYMKVLQKTDNPLVITGGYIHPEGQGIVAIDQTKAEVKLKETRLYVYPDTRTKNLFLLIIGDKRTQKDDIQYAKKCVKKIRESGNG